MAKIFEFANELVSSRYDEKLAESLSMVADAVATYFDIDIEFIEKLMRECKFIIQQKKNTEIAKEEQNNVIFLANPELKIESGKVVITDFKSEVRLPYNFNAENMASIGDLVEGVLYLISYYKNETKIENNTLIQKNGFITNETKLTIKNNEIVLDESKITGIGLQEGFVADAILHIMRENFYDKFDLRQEHTNQRLALATLMTIPEFEETAKKAFLTGNMSELDTIIEGVFE